MAKVSHKINIIGIGLFLMAAVLSVTVISFGTEVRAAGSTYYVDIQNPSCNDSGAGSQAVPWCSINKAIKSLTAGDTAYVSPGTYDIGSAMGAETNYTVQGLDVVVHKVVRPQNSGTQANPIRLIANSTAANIIGQGHSQPGPYDAK